MADKTIPSWMVQDKYWGPLLFLFRENAKLNALLNTKYFDLDAGTIKIHALHKASAAWSQSEKFMLRLALHCFNDRNKVDLGDMDYLDSDNLRLAFTALKMRYM